MSPKPTDIVPIKLRLREALRRKIEKAAQKKAISANAEAVERLEKTFDEEEWYEQAFKEIQENRAEADERIRQWELEQERERTKNEAALRDSRILNMMIEFKYPGALLLRLIAREIMASPEWVESDENKQNLADRIVGIIKERDFSGDFI